MEKYLHQLIEISQYYGRDPEFVIAGGGNTSYKNENFLWIKSSGIPLADIQLDGFVKLDRKCLNKISEKSYSMDAFVRENEVKNDLYGCIAEKTERRPSVETSLHNLLNYSFVVHTHPTIINALTCSVDYRKIASQIFGNEILVIDYTDPGYILFKHLEGKIKEYVSIFGKDPEAILLQNHGIFVAGNDLDAIRKIYRGISEQIRAKIKSSLPGTDPGIISSLSITGYLEETTGLIARAYTNELIQEFVGDENTFYRNCGTAFTPDNIVYCKAHYLFSEPDKETLLRYVTNFRNSFGYLPKVIAVRNTGIICLEENIHSVQTAFEIFLDMLKISWYSRSFGGPNFMTDRQIEFIDTWEVENYRRKIAKSSS